MINIIIYTRLTLLTKLKSHETPSQIMRNHVTNLKLYNEIRDDGERLLQLIADEKGCKKLLILKEMGMEDE